MTFYRNIFKMWSWGEPSRLREDYARLIKSCKLNTGTLKQTWTWDACVIYVITEGLGVGK